MPDISMVVNAFSQETCHNGTVPPTAGESAMTRLATACCAPLHEGMMSEADAVRTADMLKALADPVRLRLISMIAGAPDGEACACDFAEPLERSQPTVSHHLGVLVKAGILEREQRGKWAWFRVNQMVLQDLAGAIGTPT